MDILRRMVPAAIRRRYAVKFGIALLVLGLSVGTIGLVATAGITGETERQVQDDHGSSAQQEAKNLQLWNQQNEDTLGVITSSEVVESGDSDAIRSRFSEWETTLDADIYSLSYVDTEEGEVLESTDGRYEGASTSELEGVPEEAFDEASTDVPWISDVYTINDAIDAETELDEEVGVVSYVATTPGDDDRAIVYTAEIDDYSDRFEDDGATTLVLDGDDEVMLDDRNYQPDDDADAFETLGAEYGESDITERARTEGTVSEERSSIGILSDTYGLEDEENLVGASRVYGTDWVVVTHEPTEDAYGFVAAVSDYGTYATAGGVLLIGLVGAVLGRNTAVSIDRLTRKAGRMEEGDLDVDLETKRIDNIGRLYEGFDSMRVALRTQIEEAEAAREEAERERERVQRLNEDLRTKAAEYSQVMEAAAEGDLTARMDPESENEAMADIGEEFNEMLAEIELTVAELNRFATDVATASEEVTASSEEVRSASQQVTESIQEISDGAERQNQALQSVDREMSGLSTTTEQIAASSNQVADIAAQTVETGAEGQEAARRAIDAMDEIEVESERAVEEIRRLEAEVEQIDDLIAVISDIARQTNMLALNANIEASRSLSSQDDEGFAVVAREVKELSQDVAEAADEAEERLESIRKRTEQSATEVEGTSDEVEDASEQVQEAVEALEEIAGYARETNSGVQEISAATQQQAASTQEVVAMIDDAATVSDQTTAEAQNVAAAAEEQTTALTEVSRSASDLAGQASTLSEALDRFDTDVDRDDVEESSFSTDATATADLEFDATAGDDAAVDGESAPSGPRTGAGTDDAIKFDVDAEPPAADVESDAETEAESDDERETDDVLAFETDAPEGESAADDRSTDAAVGAGTEDAGVAADPGDDGETPVIAEPPADLEGDSFEPDDEREGGDGADAEPEADEDADDRPEESSDVFTFGTVSEEGSDETDESDD
ncbi:methyl-accepting chemotaxis protein [Natrialbaceae archaeon GCM10025810]|uniref:methyl-accepting chemotaxis protein n=1 Tax=Halovalidus salilacus TaxID=3075124 RepID=UPI003617709A